MEQNGLVMISKLARQSQQMCVEFLLTGAPHPAHDRGYTRSRNVDIMVKGTY